MKPGGDDPNRDPQTTLQPGQSERPRRILISEADKFPETKGRLKLGVPTRNARGPSLQPDPATEVSSGVQRGFTLGSDAKRDAPSRSSSKTGVQPWILVVAAAALFLLIAALILRPSSAGMSEGTANERLVAQYTKYLETKGALNGADVINRRKDVVERLQAIAWAKAIGDRPALEKELTALLFLDDDKSSPLYQYSVGQLKQLGSTKRVGGF